MPRAWSRETWWAVRRLGSGRLSTLSRGQRLRLVQAGTLVRVATGGVVVRQGGPVLGAYVLLSGSVAVVGDGAELARLTAGDVIGEIAVVEAIMHTASVVAAEEVRALHLPTATARDLMRELPELRRALEETAAERLERDRRRGRRTQHG